MAGRTWISTGGLVALLVLSAVIASASGGGIERMMIVFFINLIAVLGMGVYSGNSGILSFGHLAFMALGAYLSAILTMPVAIKQMTLPNLPAFLGTVNFDLFTATVITVLSVMVFAFFVGIIISKLDGSSATITTLGLLVIVHGIIIGARDITRGSQSFFGVSRETDIVVAAIGAVSAIIIALVFRGSVWGLKLRASRDDSLSSAAMGVDVRRQRLISWVISAGIVALAGILLAHFLGAFSAKKFYFVDTFHLLAMLIVGGMATVSGALLGTVVITLVTEVLRRLEGGFDIFGIAVPELFGTTQIGIGLIILFVMYRKSGGLLERLEWNEILFPNKTQMHPDAPRKLSSVTRQGKLSARRITKSFDGLVAVDAVSLELHPGEIVGLIGPNGSGKTTLLNALSGVLPATSGAVLIDDEDVTNKTSNDMAQYGVGRTFQNIRLFSSLSVRDNILTAALINWPKEPKSVAEQAADTAIVSMGLADLADVQATTLSYGYQRRVEIARALALNPRFLFLDEPAAGMNHEETDALMNDLKQICEQFGMGILIVDHDLPLIMRLCDRVVVLNEGHLIAEGMPQDVQKDPHVVEAYLGRKGSESVAAAISVEG